MQVGNKWVSSLAVRLPAAGVELLQLREGDSIDIVVDGSASWPFANRRTSKG